MTLKMVIGVFYNVKAESLLIANYFNCIVGMMN